MFRKIYKFFASLTLALILLTVIIVATIIGTICEQRLDTEVARHYIYNASWFNAWLSMLVVNLLCVATIRYPWKGYQTGFVITHFGIITLLLGGMIDRIWGIEGYLRLNRGDEPTRIMELHEQELRVAVSGAGKEATPFQLKVLGMKSPLESVIGQVARSDPETLLRAKSPSPDVRVSVIDVKPVRFGYEPEVSVVIQSPQFGRSEHTVSLRERVDMMMADLRFLPGMPPEEKLTPRRESYFVYARHDMMTVPQVGEPVGAKATLEIDKENEKPILILNMEEKQNRFVVKREDYRVPQPIPGIPDWKLNILGYYHNFQIDENGLPGNRNANPENPAVIFELVGPEIKTVEQPHERRGASTKDNALTIYLGEDNVLRYHVKSRKKGDLVGVLEPDKVEQLYWAKGSEFSLQKYTPGDSNKQLWKPALNESPAPGMVANQGLLCRVAVGSEQKDVWVGQVPVNDDSDDMKKYIEQRRVETVVGGKTVALEFSSRHVMLPFTVELMKFEAPEDEGMEGSQSYVDFKSTLSFDGRADIVKLKPDSPTAVRLKRTELRGGILELTHTQMRFQFFMMNEPLMIDRAEIEEYAWQTHKISMNRPTTFPVSAIRPWFGLNYKFSQADHNAAMPDFSGVQVLRDPGWMPKWLGCLMICCGIFTMFYIKPYFQGRKAAQVAAALKEKEKDKGKSKGRTKQQEGATSADGVCIDS